MSLLPGRLSRIRFLKALEGAPTLVCPNAEFGERKFAHFTTAAGARNVGTLDAPQFHQPKKPSNNPLSSPMRRPKLLATKDSRISDNLEGKSIAEQLQASGEIVASSPWILVHNIPPISSLHNMLAGIEDALLNQQILDLDAEWNPTEHVAADEPPLLQIQPGNIRSVVRKALVVLSPFGRPTGWKIQFTSRSIVQALLLKQKDAAISCAWKQVRISEWHPELESDDVLPQITSATLRVEGYPHHMSPLLLMNLFSRFDLDESKSRKKSIEPWQEKTIDGKSSNNTWLVHFDNASWARAAMREKQSTVIKGNTLVLSPYPEQIL